MRRYAHAVVFSLFWLWAVRDLVQFWDEYLPGDDAMSAILFHWRWISALVAGAVIARVWRASVAGSFRVSGLRLRGLVYVPLVAMLTTTVLDLTVLESAPRPRVESAFFAMLLTVVGVWGFRLGASSRYPGRDEPRGKLARGLDVVLMNVLIVLLLSESLLTAWGRMSYSPLFSSGSARKQLDQNRSKPGQPYFDFRLNGGGYHDEEFFTASSDDLVIAVLADSFGVGVVPYDYHFVTLAERRLIDALGSDYRRVALHNFGVAGIGPDEYAYLLETEVLQTRPTLVVLALFTGNDILQSREFGKPRSAFRYSLRGWLTWIVPARLLRVSREVVGRGGEVTQIGRTSGKVPEYVGDPDLEPPTFSEQRFLEIEAQRFEICNPANPETLDAFVGSFRALRFFSDKLGDRLVVVIIPDEFQVNDTLYDELLRRNPEARRYPRDYVSERIDEQCRELALSCLDLLPVLREAEADRRTYHLRDTHLNAHGNRVAGQALAGHLLERLSAPQGPARADPGNPR